MEVLCFSKDSGKTVSPTGNWETPMFTHHRDWLICPIFWYGLWCLVKYHAPGWEVCCYGLCLWCTHNLCVTDDMLPSESAPDMTPAVMVTCVCSNLHDSTIYTKHWSPCMMHFAYGIVHAKNVNMYFSYDH